jgi:prepilin-type N-terminal cleavage/methylation domain-containing protein
MKLPFANCQLPIAPGAHAGAASALSRVQGGQRFENSADRQVRPTDSRFSTGSRRSATGNNRGFTLLEVMIAIAIFFIGSFAILGLISSSLNNVRRLQRPSVDAGPVLARFAATNILIEGTYSGSLGDPDLLGKEYRDYNWAAEVVEVSTNHLYGVTCVIRPVYGRREVISQMHTVLYRPQSPAGSLDGGIGLTAHHR